MVNYLEKASLIVLLVLLLVNIYLLMNLKKNVLKISECVELPEKSDEKACSKACLVMFGSNRSFIDKNGYCWCEYSRRIILGNKIYVLKGIANLGVIKDVEETVVIVANATS